jgi:acetyl esterase/lipase
MEEPILYADTMDLLSRPLLATNCRIRYGDDAAQFGDFWLPDGEGPFPLVVFFHGGWWKSEYTLGYAGYLCAALKAEGIATWSVEYRRVGATGGGWPATFEDAASGFDYVSTLIETYFLDPARIITMGHSAGGHLAFWIAGRQHVANDSEIFRSVQTANLRGIVALAGAVDLRLTIDLAGDSIFAHDRDEVHRLMGGSPDDVPERYDAGNPGDLLPLQAPQFLIQGSDDDQIPPEMMSRWAARSRRAGSDVVITKIPGAGHFDVVDPSSSAWAIVLGQIKASLGY